MKMCHPRLYIQVNWDRYDLVENREIMKFAVTVMETEMVPALCKSTNKTKLGLGKIRGSFPFEKNRLFEFMYGLVKS